ncbi:PQQ-binding-like beta-propeller repeat protein [Rubritalea tangerina]|uniref:PQQ-binding-like beta-propeller repeat protein n=1 Tax=Rubritalea tangerina TaxID=430798 RepID=UPI00360C6190
MPLVFSASDGKRLGQVSQAGGTFAILDAEGNFFAGPQNQRERNEQMRAFTPDNSRVATFNNTNRLVVSGSTAFLHSGNALKAFDMKKNNELMAQIQPLDSELNSLNKEIKKKPNDAALKERKKAIQTELDKLRKQIETCWLWEQNGPVPLDLITTPETIVAGYPSKVAILSRSDGSEIWQAPIKGKVHGLTISNGILYVSTDRGAIHAFKSN